MLSYMYYQGIIDNVTKIMFDSIVIIENYIAMKERILKGYMTNTKFSYYVSLSVSSSVSPSILDKLA